MTYSWSQALVTILGHALWQGAIIALAAWLVVRRMERPSDRFSVLLAALVATLICPVLTYAISKTPLIGLAVGNAGHAMRWPTMLAWLWAVGATVRAATYGVGWMKLRAALRKYAQPASPDLALRAAKIARALRFSGAMRVLEASAEIGPATFGILKHVLVIPASVVARLSPEQLDAILAHEIAHMMRDDFLVSLVQGLAESVLFFHPGVWWISGQLRRERELCCDELAMGYVRSPVIYAEALVGVADLKQLQVSMAATGGSLLARIRHLRTASPSSRTQTRRGVVWMPALAFMLVLLGSAAFGAKQADAPKDKFITVTGRPAEVFFLTPDRKPQGDFTMRLPNPRPAGEGFQQVRIVKIVRFSGTTANGGTHEEMTVTAEPVNWTYASSAAHGSSSASGGSNGYSSSSASGSSSSSGSVEVVGTLE